jgi:hypothetical protein
METVRADWAEVQGALVECIENYASQQSQETICAPVADSSARLFGEP